jgi:hypothetical protein
VLRYWLFLAALAVCPFHAFAQDQAFTYRLLKLDGQYVKWGPAAFGDAASLTYAFLSDAAQFEDARNCRSMAQPDAILERNGIERADFENAVAAAFSRWQVAAGVRFEKAATPVDADILIGVDLDSRGWAHADVQTSHSTGEIANITRGLICLNAEQPWKIGFGADPAAQDIQYTVLHEIGHTLGLNHPGPTGEVMSFTYSEDFADLQAGDIEGARKLYGTANEPSPTVVASAPITPAP